MKDETKFLIIDDSEIDRLITSRLLNRHTTSENIICLESAEKGLSWLKENRNKHGHLIIIIDMRMPGLSGFEFLEIINLPENNYTENAQVFMLSASLSIEEHQFAKTHKYIDRLFIKPLPLQELLRHISLVNAAEPC